MLTSDLEKTFRGIWRRALNDPSLNALTPEIIVKWAVEKGLDDATATLSEVGAFHPTPSIILKTGGGKGCFPTVSSQGDERWNIRRRKKTEEALLWEKMEWFCPLWLPMGKLDRLLLDVRHCTRERAVQLFDYHTSTLYTLAFQAVCIAQIMPQARSLKEILPLAREAYLAVFSGYKASSIAALIPAMEGSLTRMVSDLAQPATTARKTDHAINRAIATAAILHFDGMWVPPEYKTSEYLFGQDERVFVFETFRTWLKKYFFCSIKDYKGITWLNRHMFAHGTASSWQQHSNYTRLVVALTTLAAIESSYDASQKVAFWLPEMNDDSKILWQQAQFQVEAQMTLKRIEQDRYQKYGRLVPEMPTDNGVTLRKAVLLEDCMQDLVRPLREAGWSIEIQEPDEEALYVMVTASHCGRRLRVALLFSCGTENRLYRMFAEKCDAILYRGPPYKQESFAFGVSVHVGPVLGWQPPKAIV